MSLWVDKYRPTKLEQIDCNKDVALRLKKLTENGDCPHLLIHGPPGAGKRTQIMSMLRDLYGPGVMKIKIDQRQYTTPTKVKVEVTMVSSNYHIELNPSDVGTRDCFVIQAVLKEMAQSQQIDSNSQRSYKVVVLHETDRLTKQAQQALRRTMEKYAATCRLILCCSSSSQVMSPIRSRCLHVRVGAPTVEEIANVLLGICKKENLRMPEALAVKIAESSERNLRRAILTAETCRVQEYPFREDQKVTLPDWQLYIRSLAQKILTQQSPQRLLEVRTGFYELITHCIPTTVIIKTLLAELVEKLDAEIKIEATKWAAFYEHRMHLGSKDIFHLEAFAAKFMSIYKNYITNMAHMDFD